MLLDKNVDLRERMNNVAADKKRLRTRQILFERYLTAQRKISSVACGVEVKRIKTIAQRLGQETSGY